MAFRLRWVLWMALAWAPIVGGGRLFAADWEGLPVKAVRQQPEEAAQKSLNANGLEQVLIQKAGQPYSSEKIRQSIQRLYSTGRFTDIRVDAERRDGGVVLTFFTKSAYFIGYVRVRGVTAPPGESQLRSATRLELGHLYSKDAIATAVKNLRQVLEEDGYYNVKIASYSQPNPKTQQVDVTFEVTTGARAKMGKVEITGTPVFPAAKLIAQTKWKRGHALTSKLVQDGLGRIRKLYQKENYFSASVRIDSRTFQPKTDSVDFVLAVRAGPQVEVSVAGASVSRSKLKQLIPVFEEGSLDDDLLDEGQRNLTDYLQSEGYFDVTVSYRRQDFNTRSVIEYQVDLGRRQHLQAIRISGNRYFDTETLREQMKIQPASFGSPYGRYSSKLLTQDLASIRTLYQNNGFAQVQVNSKLRNSAGAENQVTVSIGINEGSQTRVGKFSIIGNHSFSQKHLEMLINGGSGQPYSESVVASDRDNLLTFYFDQGFPEASFQSKVSPAAGKHRMDVRYIIDEGPREYVNHIYVNGLQHTRPGVVNRRLAFRDDTPLSRTALLDTQRDLYDLGIFTQVRVAVQNPSGHESERNLLVYLQEARRYTMKLGLGAEIGRFGGSTSDVTNVQGKTEFSPDISFEVSRLDVGGRPHIATLSGRFSTLQKRAGLSYTAPDLLNHPGLEASAGAFFDDSRDVRTFTAKRAEGGLQVQYKKSKITTFLARYSFRRVTVDTNTLRISPADFAILARPVLVGMMNAILIRDTRDDPSDSHQGAFTSIDFGVAAKQFGSQASFVRLLLQNSSYYRLGKRLVLARSTQIGLQSPFGEGRVVVLQPAHDGQPEQDVVTREIPIAEHFFSGGGNTHRGFAVNQAGPRDPVTGFPLGGNALALNTVELRFPIWGANIGGVLFHDMGNVFTGVKGFTLRQHQKSLKDFNYISHAVGLGLRYRTPVGPIRLDLGYNLNPPRFLIQTGGTSTSQSLARWQLLFSIGQSF